MNGATIVSRERGLTTFRSHRIMFMRMMAGPDGVIGSGRAQSPPTFLNIDPSRRPAFLRGLGLKSGTEWKDYCRSGKKPAEIAKLLRLTAALQEAASCGLKGASALHCRNVELD